MQNPYKKHLLLEQLEDRIFLDANPVAAGADSVADPVTDQVDLPAPADSVDPVPEPAAMQPVVEPMDPVPDSTAAEAPDGGADPAGDTGSDTVAAESAGPQSAASQADTTDSQVENAEVDVKDSTADTDMAGPDTETPADLTTDTEIPVDPMIGEDFDFTVTFDNTTTSTVYGPYVDLLLDGGQDGSDAASDGISFVGADYLNADVQFQVIDIVSNGQEIEHPWAADSNGDPLKITGVNGRTFRAGDQFVSLLMPFGSFETNQPAAEVTVTAHMSENADVGTGNDLAVEVTSGARYGSDALDNPTTDPPLRDIDTSSLSFAPEVITYNADIEVAGVHGDCQEQHAAEHDTRYQADNPGAIFESNHQEIPTGPNYPGTYVVRIGIANGQSVDNLVLTEHLPDNIVYQGNVRVTDANGTALGFQSSQSGQELQVTLDSAVTGTSNATDVFIRYDFYVPEQTSSHQDIIDPITGNDVHIVNNGEVSYSWTPVDTNDPTPVNGTIYAEVNGEGHFSDNPDIDDISHAQSIAIQKDHSLSTDTGASGYSPGDTVDFTLDFQISDYFSFGDADPNDSDYSFRIDDLVPDGLTMNNDGTDYQAVIDIWQGNTHYHMDLTSTTTEGDPMWVATDGDNNLEVHYNLQKIYATFDPASGGILHGDLADDLNQDGPTHGRITYSAEIARVYHDEDNSSSGGSDNDLDQGDILASTPSITGDVYTNGAFSGESEQDQSCDSLQIVTGEVSKDIYAINGSTGVGPNPHISPGDTVTYRLHYDMPISSTEDFHLTDYLPLPVFDVNDPDQDGTDSGWSQVTDDSLPGAGEWAFTGNDDYHNLNPTMDSAGAGSGNTLVFDWAPYHDDSGTASTVEILFTVTVSNEPFADGMSLTNQVRATEQGTPLADNNTDAIIQVVLDQPELQITKGVVETDNDNATFHDNAQINDSFTSVGSSGFRVDPTGTVISPDWLAANDMDTDLEGIDAGDEATFAIVVQNIGHSGAFDIRIDDDLPTGFVIPGTGLNLSVTDGAGNALTYTDASGDAPGDAGFDFFSGILLDDDSDGALNASSDNGDQTDNILVITYDLQAADTVQPLQQITNTAVASDYAGTEGGADHYPDNNNAPRDTATVTILEPVAAKTIIATGETSTDGLNVVIGETVQYQVEITVPEGESLNVHLADTLDSGLAIVGIDSITASSALSADAGSWSEILNAANSNLASPGDDFSIDFGKITNSDRDNTQPETVTVTYTVVVLNEAGNQQGTSLNNAMQWQWDNADGSGTLHTDAHAPEVTVQEPDLEVNKEVWDPATSSWLAADNAAGAVHSDQGDSISYRITIGHSSASREDAFDAAFSDTLPADIDWSSATVTVVSGDTPTSLDLSAGVLTATWDELDLGHATTLEVSGGMLNTATTGQIITNTGTVTWESLDSDATTPTSNYNSNSYERTGDPGDPGGSNNDYSHSDPGVIVVAASIDKLDPSPDHYTIGDQVTYDILVTLPEGDTLSLEVSDDLPAGMTYVGFSMDTTGFSDPSEVANPSVSVNQAGDVFFSFGDVSVTDNSSTADNAFHILVTTVVDNVVGNHQGTTLTNHAAMTYSDPADPTTTLTTNDPTDPVITVVEPQITTTKDVSDPANPSVGVLPGEALTYTVVLENTGTSTAYEVTALDTLPTGVRLDTGTSPTATYGDGSDATITITDNGNGTLSFDSATAGTWDLAVNDTITITYSIEVVGAGYVVGPHTNTIDADWTNRDGDPAPGGFERVYDDGVTQPQHTVDQTQDEDPATFTVLSNPPSLGNYIWFDQNGDGHQDANEPGISNVVVNLYADTDGDGNWDAFPLATATTDANGNYIFANLPLTTYSIPYKVEVDSSTLPGGMFQTWENANYNSTTGYPDGDLNGVSIVEVLDDTNDILDVDFGYRGQNSVGDTVWYDVNGDENQDTGEDGINGLSVTLHADIDGDGIAEYTETQITRTINGVDGQYLFEHLPYSDMQNQPDFTVTITPPADSTPTYDQDGGLDNTTTFDLDRNDPHLTDDNNRDDIDFGLRGTSSIGDFIWYDGDGNGAQNEGSAAGIGGVSLTLTGDIDGDGTIDYTATTTTAADGSYSFDHLLGGNYTITVDDATLPGGASNWNQTYDEDGTGTANTVSHALSAGNNDDGVDFGYTGTGSLGDTVWYDTNANGVQEGNEVGLAGITVTISADLDNDGIDEYTNTAVTDTNGNYSFDHLAAADYTITVDTTTLPDGATPTYDLDSATSSPDSTTVYTLGVGENTDRVDFGYTGQGSIGDTVWNDIDGDGVQDTGEDGISGVTVTLTGDLDGDGQADDTITTTTDADGHYSFDNLFFGDYTVAVDPTTLPPGTSQTHDYDDPQTTAPNTANSAVVTIDANSPDNNDVDFGYNSKGTIGDTIWYDADGDGIQDADERGLAGVTVTLTGDTDGDGTMDTVVATTDANGHYLFDQLTAGDYTITISNLPDGMAQTADPDGVSDNTTTLTLAGGATNLDQDFGYTGTGSIGDTIWNDADGDGTRNSGETGLAGVTVTLTADLNNDGVMDTVTTTTDANGNYHFDNLPADNYTITVDPTSLPPGMQQTADPDGGNDNTANVTLAAGATNNDQDFGYLQTGTIGDTIWYDANGDGIQDPDELGLNGVTVTLTDAGGNTVATTTTGPDGRYLFDGLAAGDYTVTLSDLPNGMTQTADPDGGNDNSAQVTIGAGSLVNLDQDFGYTGTGAIGDTIWNDANGDGIQDPGETGLAGVTVTLSGDFNGDGIPDTVTTTTDASGNYHFDHLPEGQYTITVDPATLPPGMQPTADPDGGNDNTAAVTLGGGNPMDNMDQDFGYRQTGTIGDTIWYDADGDGIQDPGELGLANVQVTLVGDLDGDGQADDTLTTVTDANGHYLFDRLPAGTYVITVDTTTLPSGMTPTFDADGTGTADSSTVTITDGGVDLDQDFGYTGTGSIGDTIWYDADGDSIQDPGEVGIPGVTVTITGDFDNDGQADDTMTVTTGPDGSYIFPNLPGGAYDITVDPNTLPGGMAGTGDPDGVVDNTTTLVLAAAENNLVQDFGYAGTGSIGDQLWNDANGNGIMDPGEAGLAGVEVCIGVDLDGDGRPDYRTTTTTDASGTYLFDNLPAGSHTVCVNPATLPPGIRPSFDPDGTGDNTTVVHLGAGEQNRSTDFGYLFPAVPPTIPDHRITPVPVPGTVTPALPAGDSLLMYQQFTEQETLFYPFAETHWTKPLVPISPIYSGHSEPGTTLFLTLFDMQGNEVGYQTVMADTTGNWLASFPGSMLYDIPHHLEIEQTISTYNASSAGLFNMRTYFNPNFSSMVFSTTPLTVDSVFANLPSTIMESIHNSNLSSFNIAWNRFTDYEFLSPSINPSNLGH